MHIAGQKSELWDGERSVVKIGGKAMLLINLGGEIFAFEDRCVHLGVALSSGQFDKETVTCKAHGWSFDIRSGCGVNPKNVSLRRFSTHIDGDKILVDVL